MMKKLLIFMLVLGMATLANAALQISIDGDLEPIDSQITLLPSETLIVDIWTDADIGVFGGHVWVLTVTTATGDLGNGIAIDFGIDVATSIAGDTESQSTVVTPTGEEGWWGSITNFSFSVPIPAGTKLYDLFELHCEAEGDAVISVYESPGENIQITDADLMDRVIIHQIPEPATVLLLGLGGLFLRRRRK